MAAKDNAPTDLMIIDRWGGDFPVARLALLPEGQRQSRGSSRWCPVPASNLFGQGTSRFRSPLPGSYLSNTQGRYQGVLLDYWFEPPINRLLAGGLLGIAGLSFSLCIRRFILACRQAGGMASAQWFVRAIRWLLIALTALAWAAGFFWSQSWLLIIGLIILAQELYEGAILGAALRTGQQIEKGKSPLS
jgi:hypothetical protein